MEKSISKKEIYRGKILNLYVHDIETENNIKAKREIIEHKSAVAMLGITEDGLIPIVRQYRFAVDDYVYEIPAGLIEEGEDPIEAAKREFQEETGYELCDIKEISRFYVSPGYTDEMIYLYKGTAKNKTETCFDEDEFLEIKEFKFSDIKKMISENKFVDGKTLFAFSLYENEIGEINR